MHVHVITDHCLQALLLKSIPLQCHICFFASRSSNLFCENVFFVLMSLDWYCRYCSDTVEINEPWTLKVEEYTLIGTWKSKHRQTKCLYLIAVILGGYTSSLMRMKLTSKTDWCSYWCDPLYNDLSHVPICPTCQVLYVPATLLLYESHEGLKTFTRQIHTKLFVQSITVVSGWFIWKVYTTLVY